MNIDLDQVKILLEMVSQTDVSELTIEVDEGRITIKKSSAAVGVNANHSPAGEGVMAEVASGNQAQAIQIQTAPPTASAPAQSAATTGGNGQESIVPILAPMVGTFYGSPSPTAPPFVEVGDKITIGQTICIIEAMKLMNDLPSEIAGRVVKICAQNGSTVEYGQQLFLIDTNG